MLFIAMMVMALGQTSPPVYASEVPSTLARGPIAHEEDSLLGIVHDAFLGGIVGALGGVVEGFVACTGAGMVVGGLVELGIGMVGGALTNVLGCGSSCDPYEATGLPQRARIPTQAFD
jgi:hypothetical protein